MIGLINLSASTPATAPAEPLSDPLWILILVGALSGVIGAVVGPIMQRTFGRNDRALDARQEWVKQKLQAVFGIGDPVEPSDGPQPPFMRLVPSHIGAAHYYDMHTINPAVEESVDLMMLQPRRSAWARQWLYDWHFTLHGEFDLLHSWMHFNDEREIWSDKNFDKAAAGYQRRVRRVQSSLSIWGTGQWLTHPSLRMRLSTSRLGAKVRSRRRRALKLAPSSVLDFSYASCSCGMDALHSWGEIQGEHPSEDGAEAQN